MKGNHFTCKNNHSNGKRFEHLGFKGRIIFLQALLLKNIRLLNFNT